MGTAKHRPLARTEEASAKNGACAPLTEPEARALDQCLGWVEAIGWRPMYWDRRRRNWFSPVDESVYRKPTHFITFPATPEGAS